MNQHPSYELFEELGRGVNTVVYRAYDLSLGREVAIKELDETGRRDPRHRERFLREAQFLAQFENDNVLRVYSVDTERGWIVMELMKGTLASIITAGPSSPDLVRSVLKQTLEALAFLHEKSKVHGTVRPTNLLINEAGRVKLSEFEQTAVGGELRVPTGSKKYLAPELIRSEFGEFGPPLDLYCLGFTALELLKGEHFDSLFPGTGNGAIDADLAWLRWHSSPDELAPMRKLVKGIPDDLGQVLDQMLKKRVSDRPQTAQEVLKELADRPFVAVPVMEFAEEEVAPGEPKLTPGFVRTLAPGEKTVLPSGNSPAVAGEANNAKGIQAPLSTASAKPVKEARQKAALASFSKAWFNHQLGRPYVLYPLCAAILLGAAWFSFGSRLAGRPAEQLVAVTFDVEPDSKGLVLEDGMGRPITGNKDGTYHFKPGPLRLSFRKPEFQELEREFEISHENSHFAVKLVPDVKFHEVAIEVTPAAAALSIGGNSTSTSGGRATFRLEEKTALEINASLDKHVPFKQTFSAEDLAHLKYKVSIELERERPKLPTSLVAAPGATVDSVTQLPMRVVSTRLTGDVALEFVLVKPGKYNFGSREDRAREGELSGRAVTIEEPFYIAVNEVTNVQYKQFYDSAGETKAGSRWQRAARKWAEKHQLDPLMNELPATNMSIDEATAFCQWVGGRLPSEVEWEISVRGADDRGFPFPWGATAPNRDNCRIFHGELAPLPVRKLTGGASPLGLLNSVGNAAEWCTSLEGSRSYILRGCSFATANIHDVSVTWRREGSLGGEEDTGFRMVVPIADFEASGPLARDHVDDEPAADRQVEVSQDTEASRAAPVPLAESDGHAGLPTPLWFVTNVPWGAVTRAAGLVE